MKSVLSVFKNDADAAGMSEADYYHHALITNNTAVLSAIRAEAVSQNATSMVSEIDTILEAYSGEQNLDLSNAVWTLPAGDTPVPSVAKYRWYKTGKMVYFQLFIKMDQANSGFQILTFDLPAGTPAPALWTGQETDDAILASHCLVGDYDGPYPAYNPTSETPHCFLAKGWNGNPNLFSVIIQNVTANGSNRDRVYASFSYIAE